jgi:hypothetical protein
MQHLGYVPLQQPKTPVCAHVSVLMTDLTVNSRHRKYQLLDGRPCKEINDDKHPSQAKRTAQIIV